MKRTASTSVIWLIIVAGAVPIAASLDRRTQPASRVDGAESSFVQTDLDDSFASPFARTAALVVPNMPDADSFEGRARVRSIVARFDTLPFVTAVASPASSLDTLLIGSGGTGAIIVAGIRDGVDGADAIDALRAVTADMEGAASGAFWTGSVALETDLRRASAGETRRAERRALGPTLALALWAFGGIAAAAIGIAAGASAVVLALAFTALAAMVRPVTVIAPGIASLLGLALGIDYALLALRGRSAGRSGATLEIGSSTATIRLAGVAAAAAFAPLLLVPVSELRSAAIAGLSAIAAAVITGLVWVAPLGSSPSRQATEGRSRPTDRWTAVARSVIRRPVRSLVLALAPLVLLASFVSRLEVGYHDVHSLPAAAESVRALRTLESMDRAGVALGIRVIVTLPERESVFDDAGWAHVASIERTLLDDDRVGAIRSIRTASGGIPAGDVRRVFPVSGLRTFTSADERKALIEVIPARALDAAGAASLVRDMRRDLAGAGVRIGGVPAHSVDYADAIARHAIRAAALAVAAAFIVLLVAFRSVLIAAKAVALNLLSATAAVGATVLAFQSGTGGWLAGMPLDGLFPTVPLLAFCAVFAIGMDYEVFLLARIHSAHTSGMSDDDAIVHGVASTAPLITRAAVLMLAVFTAFAVGDFVVVRMVGFALAIAVAVDATLIRLVVVPALMRIAGHWNWWPGERVRDTARTHDVNQHAIHAVP